MIAHCAGHERYFGVLGMIMDGQDKWMRSDNPLDALKKMVRLAGMTGQDVDALLQRQDLASAIQVRAAAGGKRFDIDSTPSLVINGLLIVGARDYAEFDKALKAAK
jgi:protein-disulfide isomerase